MIALASGCLNGLKLKLPSGAQTRPSGERLRQGIFNVLRGYQWEGAPLLEGALVIDIFAGSGAWGLEAVPTGATGVVFVESHPNALDALRGNVTAAAQALKRQGGRFKCNVMHSDVVEAYERLPSCRVLFADPPYSSGWFEKLLALEEQTPAVEVGGLFIYEAHEKEPILTPEHEQLAQRAGLDLRNDKKYGDSRVYFYVKRG